MLMPSIFGENLLDNWFDQPFTEFRTNDLMKTDVKETENGYELIVNMPGVQKENVKVQLKDGYLTIHTDNDQKKEEKDKEGRYIRRERYSGSCSRSFYVGEGVKEEDVKAKFEDGTLKLFVPKKEAQPEAEEKKYISIEG